MPHTVEIPVPVFKQLPPVEDLIDVKECDYSNDADYEIFEHSVHRRFDQHELND